MKLAIKHLKDQLRIYRRKPLSLALFLLLNLAMLLTIASLIFVIGYIFVNGVSHLTPELVFGKYSSDNPSMSFAIVTTIILVIVALLLAAPLSIFCAIYLTEYAKRGNKIVKVIRLATETLAGIPSIVYGLFGSIFFGTVLGWGYSILTGACTVAIMVLPVIIRSTEESILSVPDSYREGSYGLGASKLRTVFKIVLPSAMPGILSAVILSVGRIVGETATLIFTLGSVAKMPGSLLDSSRTLAVHMYISTRDGGMAGRNTAFATGVILVSIVLVINLLASYLAKKVSGGKTDGE